MDPHTHNETAGTDVEKKPKIMFLDPWDDPAYSMVTPLRKAADKRRGHTAKSRKKARASRKLNRR